MIQYSGATTTGCPAVNVISERVAYCRRLPAFTTLIAGERFLLPALYADVPKYVTIYNLEGKVLCTAIIKGKSISLRKYFGLPNGMYMVKVRAALEHRNR